MICRFVPPTTGERFDERMLVIRTIFHDRRSPDEPGSDLSAMSANAVGVLIANRLAEELGAEKEIWVLEYEDARPSIWEGEPERQHVITAVSEARASAGAGIPQASTRLK